MPRVTPIAAAAFATFPPFALASTPSYTLHPAGIPGYDSVTPAFLTPTGRVVGTSTSYNPASGNFTQLAWSDDGSATTPIGLTGPDYTSVFGDVFSKPLATNDVGDVLGYSNRYAAPTVRYQRAAWLFDPATATTTRIGYFGDGFVASDGNAQSVPQFLDAAGRAYGYSVRFDPNSTTSLGAVAWAYRPADHSLTPLGYDGTPGPFTPVPHQSSTLLAANPAGQVIGSTPTGTAPATRVYAWRYDANTNTTTPLGFYDAPHTSADGAQSSTPVLLNDTGFAAGVSLRYSPGLAYTAWLYGPTASTPTRIGLTDPAHTGSTGAQSSSVALINPAGQVAGTSQQYTSANQYPNAFLYDGHTSIPLGLTDPAHTTPDGGHYSMPTHLDSHGRVAGYSYLYRPDIVNTTVPNGRTAWLYTPGAGTIPLGLTGPGYVSTTGGADTRITHVSDAGPIAGYSERISSDPNDPTGDTPWVFDPASNTTTPVGLSGGIYTSSSHNLQLAYLTSLNDAGQALGYNQQFDSLGSTSGKTAWFYDPVSHSTIPLVFSTRPDGLSVSDPLLLTPDGTVFGTYDLYTPNSTDFTQHLFRWSLQTGMTDLGDLLSPPGPFANGFYSLDTLLLSTPNGLLAGTGTPLPPTPGSLAFLLTPTTPEPAAALLLASLLPLAPRRRRRC